MRLAGRSAPLVLVALTAGCFHAPPDEVEAGDGSSGTTEEPAAGSSASISTVTSDGGGASASGSAGAGTEGTTDEAPTGGAFDEAPTITLTVNGSATPGLVSRAGTQTIAAAVADDRGLARVEVFFDDAPTPFAEVTLAGSTAEVVEVGLLIPDQELDGEHTIRAVVHDDAMQATESAAVALAVDLPEGGSPVWESVSPSKYASKALGVAVDSIGDVIAVGEQTVSGDGHRSRMMIRKYHAETGEVLWQREVPTQIEAPTPAGNNVARAVAVDAYDNVYVIGEVRPDGKARSLWLGKYTSDGLRVATYTSDLSMSRGNGVAVDDAGRVYAVGYYRGPNYHDVATVHGFDAGLNLAWSDALTQVGAVKANAYGVAVDRHGDVVVVGSLGFTEEESRGLMALYSADGARYWVRIPNLLEEPRERLYGVTVNQANEYITVGRCEIWDDPRRFWHVRMNDAGEELSSLPDGVSFCGDPDLKDDTDVCGIASGPLDRLVFSGVGAFESDDFQIKQTRDDWAIHLWAPSLDGPDHATDRGLAVDADADGYVSAAGYRTDGGLPRWWVTRRNP